MYNSLKRGKLNEGFQKKLRRIASKKTHPDVKDRNERKAFDRVLSPKRDFDSFSPMGKAKNRAKLTAAVETRGKGPKAFKKQEGIEKDIRTRYAKKIGLINKDSVQYERGIIEGLGTKIIGGVAKRMITWPAAAIGGLVSGAKEVGANMKAGKEKAPTKPAKGTIKPKKGSLVKPKPAEEEVA